MRNNIVDDIERFQQLLIFGRVNSFSQINTLHPKGWIAAIIYNKDD